ncbi:MAG: phosphoesterase [Deltaproteobacteria bacterium]|nr:phosphoesterase [Deltaproteobacteria bacterium]
MIIDMHVSLDAAPDPGALVDRAKNVGLDGLVLAGADGSFPSLEAIRDAAKDKEFSVFAATRVKTTNGLLLCFVPNPTAPLPEGWADKKDGYFVATSVIDRLKELGGIAIALRPYDREVEKPMGDTIFTLVGLAACETQNAKAPQSANNLALEAASNLELPCIGTSSARTQEELGTAATLFRKKLASEADLIDAVSHGECWPIGFGTRIPRPDRPHDRRAGGGGGDRGRDRGRGGRTGRGGDRGRGGHGGDRRRTEGGSGPDPMRSGGGGGGAGSGGAGGAGRNRRRRGGGGGRGPVSDDFGNRRDPRDGQDLPENLGNRIETERELPDDIGNRLRPGERPRFAPDEPEVEVEDPNDVKGNR